MLYSRRNESTCFCVQSSGIGEIAKKVSRPLSSGPGESQYATATPRWNSGIRITLTGASGRVTRSFSRTNVGRLRQRRLRPPSTTLSRAGLSA